MIEAISTVDRALWLNGVLHFPMVLLYYLVGAGIAVYASQEPSFVPRYRSKTGC